MTESATSSRFRLQGNRFHLTYKTHLNLQDLVAFLETKGPLLMYSVVHELGKVAEPTIPASTQESPLATSAPSVQEEAASSALPYEHTHALVQYSVRVRSSDPRFFDFQGIHPNLRKVPGSKYFQNCWTYHGKAPINRLCSGRTPICDDKQWERYFEAPSLAAACRLADITPRTVGDMVLLRNEKQALPYVIPPIANQCTWTLPFTDEICVLLTGPSGAGKTRWALAHGENPLLISRLEDLKKLTPSHDLLVFDDYSFAGMSLEDCIHLVDTELPRCINVKHGSVTIPSMMPRIFTTNKTFVELFPPDVHGALARRIKVISVYHKLFSEVPVQPKPTNTADDADNLESLLNAVADDQLDQPQPDETWSLV